MSATANARLEALQIDGAARALLCARKEGLALEAFPGVLPLDPIDAYALQDAVLRLDGSEIGGWKVGTVGAAWHGPFGERLLGPIMGRNVWHRHGPKLPLHQGWFHAVEAEFAVRLSRDLPAGSAALDTDEVAGLIEEVRLAVEIVSSTLRDPAFLGPAAIIADYGLNGGLVLGAPVTDWASRPARDMHTAIRIDGRLVTGSADVIQGGLADAAAFCVSELNRRGRDVSRQHWICTGATSGLHRIERGGALSVRFDGQEAIIELSAS